MSKLTFLQLAHKVLLEVKKPLTADEIWAYAEKKGYSKLVPTKGFTPWNTIAAQLYIEVRDNPETKFVRAGSRPTRFFIKDIVPQEEVKEIDTVTTLIEDKKIHGYSERELHPFVAYFAKYNLSAAVKTIFHEKSNKKAFSEWLHPDIVGFSLPLGEWETQVINIGQAIGRNPAIFYSIELKKVLSFNNLREAFFQTVSNSSWAHEGYLAAANIDKGDEFRSELERLSTSFGIGIIEIFTENPNDSRILFPAKRKKDLDWDTVNKLCSGNPDFKNFLDSVNGALKLMKIHQEDYDKVSAPEELLKMLKK